MSLERRQDIGSKVGWTVLVSLIAFLLGILFQQSHGLASTALAKANEVELKEVANAGCMNSMIKDVGEIKTDMKKVLEHVARENQIYGRETHN